MGAAIAARVMDNETASDQYHSPPSGRPEAMLFTKKTLNTTVTITVVKAELAKS